MALITVSDIITYMDIDLSNVQEDAAEIVIEGLQSELEAYLRRPIEQQSFTEQYRVPDEGRGLVNNQYLFNYRTVPEIDSPMSSGVYRVRPYTLYLTNSPVVSVSSVAVTPASANATSKTYTAETDYIVRPYGVDLYSIYPNDKIDITYTAGLDGANIKVLKLLLLRAAAREMQNMHDDVVGLKDLTTRNVAPLETGFSERELMSIKKYRRVRVA